MIKNYLLAILVFAAVLVKAQSPVSFTISAGGNAVGSNISVPLNCSTTFIATTTSGLAGAFTWSASGGGMSIGTYYSETTTITFTNTGTYTLTAVATPSPTATNDTVRVIVNIMAQPSITPLNGSICPGASTTLSASPTISGSTYSWAPSSNLNTSTGSSVVSTPTATTEYTLTTAYLYGCPAISSTAYVTVNTAPVITVTATTGATCNGACNGQASINISNTGGPLTISPTSWAINLYAASSTSLCAGTQSVTVTGATGCPTTQTLTISQPAPISIAINSTVTTCGQANGSAVAAISGGTPGYTFTWTPGNMNILAISNLAAGTYSLNVTDANNCPATSTTVIGASISPTVNISGIATICNGNSTTLTASGAIAYTWVTGATTASIVVTPTTTTNYSVVGTDANGCTNSTFTYVTVNAAPAITVTANIGTTCNGVCNGQASINITGVGGPLSISPSSWTLNGYSASSTSLCAGTQSVTVTGGSGCSTTQTLTISQPTAILITTSVTATSCGQANGSIVATVSGGTPGYTYVWTPGTSSASSISNLASGTYSLGVTDANSCTTGTNAIVSVSNTASITITPSSSSICIGSSATLTTAGNVSTYTWSSGANTASISVSSAGIYTVNGTDANGCTNSSTATVTVNNYNNLSGTIYDTTTVTGQHPITAGSVYLYAQQTGSSVGVDTSSLIVATNTLTGAYTFTNVPPGNYYVKAVASITTYTGSIPTYFNDAYLWSSATAITHSGCTSGNDAGHDITIIELPALTGNGIISGTISFDGTFGHRLANGNNQVMGAPLKGIDIKLGKNPGGGCTSRTTVASGTGTYTFTNIPDGSYSIYADMPNFGMTTVLTVTISPTNLQSTGNNYCVDSVKISTSCAQVTGINKLASINGQINLYPNPNNGIFNVQIDAYENSNLEIYNVIGQKVYEHLMQNNLEQINLSSLTEGVYLVRVLKNSNTIYQTRIIKQ
jgi:hypothetical protein